MKSKIRVLMVGPLTKIGGVANHTKSLIKVMDDKDIDILVYNSSFEGEFPKIIINIIKIYRRTLGLLYFSIKRRKLFGIIHVQSSGGLPGFLNAVTGVITSSILRKKLIVTFHHSDTKGFVSKHKKIVEFVFKKANRFILVSNLQKKVFAEAFLTTDKIRVIPNGYHSWLFSPYNMLSARKELGLPLSKKILVNIANLEEYKGQKYLIEAMKEVLTVRNNVLLYIVGRGSLKSSLQSLINRHGLGNNIVLAGGNKPRKEIPLWMNTCDVFVLASLSEGNPTVMFEALGCGKPFVGTNVGGIPEVIINKSLGILVEPKDINGLAKAILKALDTKWSEDYILNYAKQFTWDKMAEKTMGVYDEVLKKA
ncbi:MAG: glycosyltransferase family 4 protein [Thermoplasmatales archaeon]|nr:glycosyltransferase family 4 protein [Thermoplasmatales archaeon]